MNWSRGFRRMALVAWVLAALAGGVPAVLKTAETIGERSENHAAAKRLAEIARAGGPLSCALAAERMTLAWKHSGPSLSGNTTALGAHEDFAVIGHAKFPTCGH